MKNSSKFWITISMIIFIALVIIYPNPTLGLSCIAISILFLVSIGTDGSGLSKKVKKEHFQINWRINWLYWLVTFNGWLNKPKNS